MVNSCPLFFLKPMPFIVILLCHRSATSRPTYDLTLSTIATRPTRRTSSTSTTSQPTITSPTTSTTSLPTNSLTNTTTSSASSGSQTQEDITTSPHSPMESSSSGMTHNTVTIMRTITLCLLTITCSRLLT